MFGLKVRGDNGQYQVLSEAQSMVLRQRGLATVVGKPNAMIPYTDVGVTLTDNSMVFLRPRSAVPVHMEPLTRATLGRLRLRAEYTVDVDWFVFDVARNASDFSGNYGIRVYKDDRSISYSSGSNVLNIVGINKVPDVGNGIVYDNLPSHTISLPSGRIYAAHLTNSRCYVDMEGPPAGGGPYNMFHYDGVSVGSGFVQTREVICDEIATDSGAIWSLAGGLLIAADVTSLF